MRKHFMILFAGIVLLLLFVSCKKEQEGVYNPTKQIDRIFTERSYYQVYADGEVWSWDVPKHLSEVWSWSGKQLNSITYYDEDGSYWCTAKFSYQGNRIDGVSLGSNSETYFNWSYVYQDEQIVSMYEYMDNEQIAEIHFTHTGNDISRIAYTRHDLDKNRKIQISPLRFILPSVDADLYCKLADRMESKNNSKDWSGTVIYDLEWEKGNLVNVGYSHANYHSIIKYTYDNKVNPFYSSFFGQYEPVSGPDNLIAYCFPSSKNNVLYKESSDNSGYDVSESYTYTYDGKYPIVQEKNLQSYTVNGVPQNWTQREVVYYEYK